MNVLRNAMRICAKLHNYTCVMPDNKRIQGPEESYSPFLFLAEDEKRSNKPLLNEDGTRLDGRKHNEIRPIFVKTGVHYDCTGSAYVEMGNTKLTVIIYGPKEPPRREDVTAEGRVVCEFKYASFSCVLRRQHQQDQSEKEFSVFLAQALQRVINVQSFPKLQLEVNVTVIENGGSVLAASIFGATVALACGGMELYDLPVACSLSLHKTAGFLIDPAAEEEYTADSVIKHPSIVSSMTVVYLPSLGEVSGMSQNGCLEQEQLTNGVDVCVEGCLRIHRRIRDLLTEPLEKEQDT